jgi:hypothetical protein
LDGCKSGAGGTGVEDDPARCRSNQSALLAVYEKHT